MDREMTDGLIKALRRATPLLIKLALVANVANVLLSNEKFRMKYEIELLAVDILFQMERFRKF